MSTEARVPISDTELQRLHEDVPPDYYHIGVARNFFQRLWHSRRRPSIRKFLAGRAGRLLDLGCHGGYMTSIIATESNAEVTGIDISPDAIAFAKKKYPQHTFVLGDIQQRLPFHDNSFETVTAFDVLEHVPHLDQTLQEIRRVITSNGIFVVGVPRDTSLFRLVWHWWTRARGAVWHDVHVHDFTALSLQQAVEKHGFEVVRQKVSHWGMYLVTEFRRQS